MGFSVGIPRHSHQPADKAAYLMELAEGVRFELTVRLRVQRFSRPSQSATLAPLRRDPSSRVGRSTGADNSGPQSPSQALVKPLPPGHKWLDFAPLRRAAAPEQELIQIKCPEDKLRYAV